MLMRTLVFVPAALLTAAALYPLIPGIYLFLKQWGGRHRQQSLQSYDQQYLWPAFLPRTWKQSLARWLLRAGYLGPQAWLKYWTAAVVLIAAGLFAARLLARPPAEALLAGLACWSLLNQYINARIRKRSKAFDQALYKIYRFLNSQISAGIKVTDALRGLPDSICDPLVRPVLVRFAAVYELTYDLDQALQEISQVFSGPDYAMLAAHTQQALQTGQAGRSLQRMEELLFARYYHHLQAESQRSRQQLLWLALVGLIPTMIVLLYPLFHTATQALQTLFT